MWPNNNIIINIIKHTYTAIELRQTKEEVVGQCSWGLCNKEYDSETRHWTDTGPFKMENTVHWVSCWSTAQRPHHCRHGIKSSSTKTTPMTVTVLIPLRQRNVRKSSVATFRSGNKHLGACDDGRHLTSGVEHDGLAPFDANFRCARICHELKTSTAS